MVQVNWIEKKRHTKPIPKTVCTTFCTSELLFKLNYTPQTCRANPFNIQLIKLKMKSFSFPSRPATSHIPLTVMKFSSTNDAYSVHGVPAANSYFIIKLVCLFIFFFAKSN